MRMFWFLSHYQRLVSLDIELWVGIYFFNAVPLPDRLQNFWREICSNSVFSPIDKVSFHYLLSRFFFFYMFRSLSIVSLDVHFFGFLLCGSHSSWFCRFIFCALGSLVAACNVGESACNVGELGWIPWSGRSPGGGHGNPLQYSCLENPHGQRNLVDYSPWGHKESWVSAHILGQILEGLSHYFLSSFPLWPFSFSLSETLMTWMLDLLLQFYRSLMFCLSLFPHSHSDWLIFLIRSSSLLILSCLLIHPSSWLIICFWANTIEFLKISIVVFFNSKISIGFFFVSCISLLKF